MASTAATQCQWRKLGCLSSGGTWSHDGKLDDSRAFCSHSQACFMFETSCFMYVSGLSEDAIYRANAVTYLVIWKTWQAMVIL